MPFDDHPEFRELAPWPLDLRYRDAPTERVLYGRLPPRPDNPSRSYSGSSASLMVDADLAERSYGDSAAEHRAKDAARRRQKKAAARA
jgi:hypothetical protein